MRYLSGRPSYLALTLLTFALTAHAGKTPPPPPPPSAMVFGSWGTNSGNGEYLDFLPNKLSVQRTITIPADGAWFWGDARFKNLLEMDCDHHYRGDLDPASATYSPLFLAGELPAP